MAHLEGDDDGVGYGILGQGEVNALGRLNRITSGVIGFTHPTEGVLGGGGTPIPPVSVGVFGVGLTGVGILGQNGSSGHTPQNATIGAVWGDSADTNGVYGSSANWNGVEGDSWSPSHAGIAGVNNAGGPAVWGFSTGNAGEFHGNVLVTGNHTVNGVVTAVVDVVLGADCAEEFDVVGGQRLEPGTVAVIDESGALRESREAYDKKVVGIVSGAGDYKPGIVMDRKETDPSRTVVALIGKVFCKVDAGHSPIEIGDLLTSSPTPGYAMRASDPGCSFGAVIGKALGSIRLGRGLIPVLVALQ
jgi:hypothetical protein